MAARARSGRGVGGCRWAGCSVGSGADDGIHHVCGVDHDGAVREHCASRCPSHCAGLSAGCCAGWDDRQRAAAAGHHPSRVGRQPLLHELGPRLRGRRSRRRPPHCRHQQLLRRAVRLHRAGHLLLPRGHPGLGRHRLQLPHRQVRHRLRRTLRLRGRSRRRDERRSARPRRQHRHHGPVHDGRLQQRQSLGCSAERGGQDGRMVLQARRHRGRQRPCGSARVDH